MSLSRLSKKCRECKFVDICEHKHIEACGYLPELQIAQSAGEVASQPLSQPLLRETIEIHVDGKPMAVYKDEIEKELYKHLYSGLCLQFGG